MKTDPLSTFDSARDSALGRALREHLQDGPEPADDGFSQRVLAALPERPSPRQARGWAWIDGMRWVAVSAAGCGVAVLHAIGDVRADSAHAAAAYALIGLLAFWSMPNRWSRG